MNILAYDKSCDVVPVFSAFLFSPLFVFALPSKYEGQSNPGPEGKTFDTGISFHNDSRGLLSENDAGRASFLLPVAEGTFGLKDQPQHNENLLWWGRFDCQGCPRLSDEVDPYAPLGLVAK